MNATVKEWVSKAEGDYRTAERELHPAGAPNLDAVCSHAEQSVEKLMKALLIDRGVTPPRSHDLVALDRLLAPACSGWSWPVEELRLLTRAAVGSSILRDTIPAGQPKRWAWDAHPILFSQAWRWPVAD